MFLQLKQLTEKVKICFLRKDHTISNVTQVAIGILTNSDCIEFHMHSTMDEYYYFLEGKATFTIEDERFDCDPNTFVHIPNNIKHKLATNEFVKFLYWGVVIR